MISDEVIDRMRDAYLEEDKRRPSIAATRRAAEVLQKHDMEEMLAPSTMEERALLRGNRGCSGSVDTAEYLLKQRRARYAPKPEPTLEEKVKAILDTRFPIGGIGAYTIAASELIALIRKEQP
jgi:hypothetical protein